MHVRPACDVPLSSSNEDIGTEQFEVMADGRKTIQRGVQTELLVSRSECIEYTCYTTGLPRSFISMANRPAGARNFLPNGTMQPSFKANSMPSLVPIGPRPVPK